jgi:NADH-quinone oxidoreductase subunit J
MINIASLLFYIFSGVLLTSAMMVVTSRNTVHGVLFLILAFFNAAGLFLLANAEFLALLLVIVYVGAVAVLFLFVVMMLNLEIGVISKGINRYRTVGLVVALIFLFELLLTLFSWKTSKEAFEIISAPMSQGGLPNTQAIGNLIYTHYALIFQGSGIILLIAMIGAIVLTLRHREGVRKQKIRDQLERDPKDSVNLVDISPGSGI